MSNHSTALVPIESWCYNSPELRYTGKSIDVGLLAEALIYYDSILLNVSNQPQFAELLQWFIRQNRFSDFLALVADGTIKIYEYSFISTAILKEGTYSLLNIQDEIQAEPDTFEKRFLYHDSIQSCIKKSRHRAALYRALRGNVTEVKADEFGSAIDNAISDHHNASRNELVIQAFIDELYNFRKIGSPPEVKAKIEDVQNGAKKKVTWNVNFDEISKIAGGALNFHPGAPLTASAISNRFLWSAAQMGCDLYLGQPMSLLVGDKLYESAHKIDETHNTIDSLKQEVEFPDVRKLVNDGLLDLSEILKIRKKAQKFRDWLQDETDRDRDAITAYHHEVAKESGILKAGRKTLNLFGVLGGAYTGSTISGPYGAVIGAAVGYTFNVASKLGADWKPVIFGNWIKDRIEKVVK